MRLNTKGKYGKGDKKHCNPETTTYVNLQNKFNMAKTYVAGVLVVSKENRKNNTLKDEIGSKVKRNAILETRHVHLLELIIDSLHEIMGYIWLRKNKKQGNTKFLDKCLLYVEDELYNYLLPYSDSHPEFITFYSNLAHELEKTTSFIRVVEGEIGSDYYNDLGIDREKVLAYINRLSTLTFWMASYYNEDGNSKYWKKFKDFR